MAASSLNAVRVRLYFDYPPPSMPDCRMSWVLVDLNKCRVVADLCSVIREKFDYSRKTVLDLFIENCFLPPAESIYVVRDNDSIRVKVSSVSCKHVGKKRCREEEGMIEAPTKKNRHEPSEANGVAQLVGAAKKKKKHKAKKKKREEQQVESGDAFKAAVPAKEPSSSKSHTDKSSKKASASSVLTNGKAISSGTHNKSSGSSDSSEEVTQKPSPPKSKSKRAQIAAPKHPAAGKTSSSDSSSSEDEDKVPVKKSPKPSTSLKTCTSTKTPKVQTSSVAPKSTANSTTAKNTQTQSSSDSSSSDEASSAARKAKVPAKSTNTASKTQPLTMTTSSSSEDDSRKGSISGKTSPVLQKSVTSSKTVSLLQTRPLSSNRQGEASKISTSNKPSGNSKTSKTQTSSDSSSSSEDEACKANVPATPKPFKTAQAQTQPCSDLCAVVENGATRTPSTPVGTMLQDNEDKAESPDSCSSSDPVLVIKRPNPQLLAGLTPRGRGRAFTDRVKGRGGVRGGFGRARGTPWKQNFHYNYDNEEQTKQNEIQTNKSLVLQNPPEPSRRRDYSTLPLLAAPPAVGQKIVFKLLELTESYTPEVSDYKEGKIIGFNHSTNMIELELLTQSQARTEPGKFDLVYQNPDGSERVEYAVTLGSQLTERWESLLEPRLIVQNTD